jgi:hypothetical protein
MRQLILLAPVTTPKLLILIVDSGMNPAFCLLMSQLYFRASYNMDASKSFPYASVPHQSVADRNKKKQSSELLKIAIFWDMMPCSLFINQRFKGTYHLHLHGLKSDEVPEVGNFHNLKSFK